VAEHDVDELKMRRICGNCIGEPFLQAEVQRSREVSDCSYCGQHGPTETIEELAGRVEAAFEQHYRVTPDQPDSFEWLMAKEGHDWQRSGEPAAEAIAQAALIEPEPAEDIRLVLEERHQDIERDKLGDEGPFDQETHYEPAEVDDAEFRERWADFERSLKSEVRFFSRRAESTLEMIFDGVFDAPTRNGAPIVRDVGPGFELRGVYRARVFQTNGEFEKALKRPDKGIGPPPTEVAAAGRMNARGVSVFYGATDEAVAIAEVRPPVGSRVVVGRFDFLRPVRLLDIAALQSVLVTGSIFEPGFARRLERAKFLETLSRRITRPVMPNDEPFEYLVTQAMADFLADRHEHGLDGLLYPSAQVAGQGANVVLFNKAARVEELEIPGDTKLTVIQTSHSDEDDESSESDYVVWEEIPKSAAKRPPKPSWPPDFSTLFGRADLLGADHREPTLKIDVSSLKVHRVLGSSIRTETANVERRRRTEMKPDF
jgi:hypothetical protein